tara:strand:+ start:1141 stop:1263 length:123 start_codon:yes stop_codon:yes gene_type:complete
VVPGAFFTFLADTKETAIGDLKTWSRSDTSGSYKLLRGED